MSSSSEEFNTLTFEKKLSALKDTQESIQALSSWCLQKREHHKKIVASWLNVLKRAKVEQRLTLFYLANDVIQYSKRKGYDFVKSWGTTLQKATPLVRDDKVKHRILRIFRIWEERSVYDEEFLTDLTGLLSAAAGKQTDVDPNDFQAMQFVNKIRQCSVLEADTDLQLKHIHESSLALNDTDALCLSLKERRNVKDANKELEEGVSKLEGYVTALQKEIVARAALCRLLQKAQQHYNLQRGEVKVVSNAYKNFGCRVRGLKRKLDDLCERLPASTTPVEDEVCSPTPSPPAPGEAVPSPGPDEDLELPSQAADNMMGYNIDTTFSSSLIGDKSFSSFLGSADFSFSAFHNDQKLKDESVSSVSEMYLGVLGAPPPPPPLLPGLDLLGGPDTAEPPPSVSLPLPDLNFYGSNSSSAAVITTPDPLPVPMPENYTPEMPIQPWNNTWENIVVETPESPPLAEQPATPAAPLRVAPVILSSQGRVDVDHRTLLPPPQPPMILMEADDVDHRILPPLPVNVPQERNRPAHPDVDHRNLISLTGPIPPPPAPPKSPWSSLNMMDLDQDYRNAPPQIPSLPPPPSLMSMPPPLLPPPNPPQPQDSGLSMVPAPNHSLPPPRLTNQPPPSPNISPQNPHHPPRILTGPPPQSMPMNSNLSRHPGMQRQNSGQALQQHPNQGHLLNSGLSRQDSNPGHMRPEENPEYGRNEQNSMPYQNTGHMRPEQSPRIMRQDSGHLGVENSGQMRQDQNSRHDMNMRFDQNSGHMRPMQNSGHPGHMAQGQHRPYNMMHQPPPVNDNVESIDMEMSDEEHDDDFRLARIESSLARLHGNAPPMMMRQPQQYNRPPEQQKPFNNNNRVLVGGPDDEAVHTQHQMHNKPSENNESGRQLTNLVVINSTTKEKPQDADVSSNKSEAFSGSTSESQQSSPKDIFKDPENLINPVNPNTEIVEGGELSDDSVELVDDNDEPVSWKEQNLPVNPPRPSFVPHGFRGRFPPPRRGFLSPHGPPMFNRPPGNERFFMDQNRGGPRRLWGPRPPRRGNFW